MSNREARNRDLAKIHIAKKDLDMDDDVYRDIMRDVGKAKSGSAANLDIAGRSRVLAHFRTIGWKPRRSKKTNTPQQKRRVAENTPLASKGQVGKIRSFWIQLSDAGIVKNRKEQGLRAWIKAATRSYHPKRSGWSAPEFLPGPAAQAVIEQLKQWAKRCSITLTD